MYDPRCQDLAEEFLSDEPFIRATFVIHEQRVKQLAQVIQDAIEGWLDTHPHPTPEAS